MSKIHEKAPFHKARKHLVAVTGTYWRGTYNRTAQRQRGVAHRVEQVLVELRVVPRSSAVFQTAAFVGVDAAVAVLIGITEGAVERTRGRITRALPQIKCFCL